ncbi:MAG: hypothetical protein Q9181_003745 [Wetmoreana brouardii]
MTIAGVTLQNTQSDLNQQDLRRTPAPDNVYAAGILGIGFKEGEAGAGFRNETIHPNIVFSTVSGLIASTAVGSILSITVDNFKFRGPFTAIPVVSTTLPSDVPRTAIQMTSLNFNDKVSTSSLLANDTVLYAILGSGATNSLLPRHTVEAIGSVAGVLSDDST